MDTFPAWLTARKSNPVTSVTCTPARAASTAASVAGSTPMSGAGRIRPTRAGASAEAPVKPGSTSRMPSSTAATSAPSGPTVSIEGASGYTPSSGTRPQVVFRPAIPQQAPGIQRVRRRARPWVHPAGRPAQLGQVGLADDPRPGPPGRRHHRRVSGRRARLLRDRLAAGRGGQALDVDAVLDGQPRAVSGGVKTHDPGGIHDAIVSKLRSHGRFAWTSRRLLCRDLLISHRVTMRVAIITESFPPDVNGVAHCVLRVAELLTSHGHHPLVIAPQPPRASRDEKTSYPFPVVRVPAVPLPGYPGFRLGLPGRRVRAALLRHRAELVHLASPVVLGAHGAAVARRLGLPTVAGDQTDLPSYARPYRFGRAGEAFAWRGLRGIHNGAVRTLAPSTVTATGLLGQGIENVWLWGRGVDTQRFHPAKRSPQIRAGLAPGELIAGYVGRLATEKRVD